MYIKAYIYIYIYIYTQNGYLVFSEDKAARAYLTTHPVLAQRFFDDLYLCVSIYIYMLVRFYNASGVIA